MIVSTLLVVIAGFASISTRDRIAIRGMDQAGSDMRFGLFLSMRWSSVSVDVRVRRRAECGIHGGEQYG
jgi:hypothetical protein